MKIEHLYYFLIIADTKSINQAAQRLYISQQQLSRIVSKLEEDLHTQLLQRYATGIKLTAQGDVFLQFAEKIVNEYREMQSYFYLDMLPSLNKNQICGSCKISVPFFFSLFLNDFITECNASYPDVKVKCFENADHYTLDQLYQSKMLHLLIASSDQKISNKEKKLVFYYLGESDTSICVNRSSPLATKSVLTHKDIASQKQTAFPQIGWNSMLNNDNILFISSNIYQHLDSVVHNQSVCIIPTYVRSSIYAAYPDIVLIPFDRYLSFPIYVIHSKEHLLTNADKAVIRFLEQYLKMMAQR